MRIIIKDFEDAFSAARLNIFSFLLNFKQNFSLIRIEYFSDGQKTLFSGFDYINKTMKCVIKTFVFIIKTTKWSFFPYRRMFCANVR